MKKLLSSLLFSFIATIACAQSVLTVPQGGTGNGTLAAGVVKANGTSPFSTVAAPTGAIVGTTDTQTLSGKTLTNPGNTAQTLSYSTATAWNAASGAIAYLTLTASTDTLAAPTNLTVGTYILFVIQGGTGSYTLAWNAIYKWVNGTAPTLSTGVGKTDICTFVYNGTGMYGSCVIGF